MFGGVGSQLIFPSTQAHAQIFPSGEQYKIVRVISDPIEYEATLNQLAGQGWKVRCTMNTYIILVK